MKILRIIVAGILFAIVSQIIHLIEAYATMNFYTDPIYFGVWSKIMMPNAGPPPNEFYYYSIILGIISGIIYSVVYLIIKKSLSGKTIVKKGLYFGFLLFLIGIPGFLSMYLLINLPTLLLVYWTITSLIIYLISGPIIALINK